MSQSTAAASRIGTTSPWMSTGVVRDVRDTLFDVVGDMGLLRAVRAADCLLTPCPGDRVLLLLDPRTCYILHVLERADVNAEATLLLPSRTSVRTAQPRPPAPCSSAEYAEGGVLRLVSDNVHVAGNQIDLHAEKLTAQAGTLSFTATAMRFAGRTLVRSFATAHSLFTHVFEKAQRVMNHYGNAVRTVDGLDESRAGRQRLTIRDSLRIRSGSASLRAEETVDVDGKHINIG